MTPAPTPPPLILLAHGSRDPLAAQSVSRLAAAAGAARPGLTVTTAYLDLADPDLATACAASGAALAVVVPLLFTPAFHAGIDVPQAVRAAEVASGVRLVTAGILGTGPKVLRALRSRAAAAGISDDRPVLLVSVGSSDPEANAAVQALADRWSAQRREPVRAAFATCEPRAVDLLDADDTAVVPLFVSPGLLLTGVSRRASARGLPVAGPLDTELAGLVLDRYDEALDLTR